MTTDKFIKACRNKNFVRLAENHQSPNRKKIVILEGGSRSGKSVSAILYLIQVAIQTDGLVINCVRQFGRTLETTLIRDFKMVMNQYFGSIYKPGKFNKSSRFYTFDNGTVIHFLGLDDEDKARGLASDFLFVNEATELHNGAFRQLQMRTRLQTIIDYNPSLSFWATDLKARDDVLVIHSTYKDNEFLETSIIREIEGYEPTRENRAQGTADEYLWSVFGLGILARPEGAIFKFVHDCPKLPPLEVCSHSGIGLDFGFSHQMGVVRWRLFQNKLYVKQLVYETGLVIRPNPNKPGQPSLVSRLEDAGVGRDELIVADSARADLISELVEDGWNVFGAKKGSGSVLLGISILQRFDIHVTEDSIDLKRELVNYHWKRKADGTTLQEPEKRDDHLVDGLRYSCVYELEGMVSKNTSRRIKSRNARTRRR